MVPPPPPAVPLPVPIADQVWTARNIAPGAILGARVGGVALSEPAERVHTSDFYRYHHTIHRDLVAPSEEFECVASFLMQASQHPGQTTNDFEIIQLSSSTPAAPHFVKLPRFSFVFKDYDGRRVTVRPLFVPGMDRDSALVKGYTFLTERCWTTDGATSHRKSFHRLLRDVKRNTRPTNVPMQDHFDQYEWYEHFLNVLGKTLVVAATGCAVLVGLTFLTSATIAAKVAAAATLKLAVVAIVAACTVCTLWPVVAIVAGVSLLAWCL